MADETTLPTPTAAPPQGRSCFAVGCTWLLVVVLGVYVVHAAVIIGINFVNQVRWNLAGSQSYDYTLTMEGQAPAVLRDGARVAVRDNAVTSVTALSTGAALETPAKTIDAMWVEAYTCALLWPVVNCAYAYEQTLGYPTLAAVTCPAQDCGTVTAIRDMALLPEE